MTRTEMLLTKTTNPIYIISIDQNLKEYWNILEKELKNIKIKINHKEKEK